MKSALRALLPDSVLCAVFMLLAAASMTAEKAAASDALIESVRQIPVAYDVDIVVVGGSAGAVAAAVEAAQNAGHHINPLLRLGQSRPIADGSLDSAGQMRPATLGRMQGSKAK